MKLFLGIDGGGTHTTACLADATGNILACKSGGAGNPNHASDPELIEHFSTLVARLVSDGGYSSKDIVSVFAGVAGVTSVEAAVRIRGVLDESGLANGAVGIDHDIRIALAGGLAGRPGIALIVGTGSSCYGRDAAGNTWQSGGWGSLISDEGSGFYLGREAMTAAVRMADGRQPETRLREVVLQWLGITHVSDIMDRIYNNKLTRPEIAAFAPTLLELANDGDPAALGILASGARELAEMVVANHLNLPTSEKPEIVITGGLGTAKSHYRTLIDAAITRQLPGATITQPELDANAGATMLAMEMASIPITPEIIANLKGSK